MATAESAASSAPSAASPISPYPYAAAPDIIRAHQKDAYFKGTLAHTLSDIHRRLLGARSAHAWSQETRTAADTIYLSLTTLIGNRTLGEEYCDIVQIDASSDGAGRLPALTKRASYIASSVLLPYALGRLLPGFRALVRRRLEARLARLENDSRRSGSSRGDNNNNNDENGKQQKQQQAGSRSSRQKALCRYLLSHLGTITSSAPVHAMTLAVFYFSGTYYELAKRLLGFRYVFTRQVPATPDRAGYEVLGILLLVQLSVQTYLHIRSSLLSTALLGSSPSRPETPLPMGPNVSLDNNAYAANTAMLPLGGAVAGGGGKATTLDIAGLTHTPAPAGGVGAPRYDLKNEKVMAFVAGKEQRKCTLCLEEMRDPAATGCGHVFCWDCIGDWVREKPECPLCRREAMVQHILPLRVG